MNGSALRPIAFMVMPFRKRPVPNPAEGSPREVDFDALWDRAFRPALEQAGYLAVRADIETGTVIIKDMLERLAFADLVLADMTLPNGNVYYEVGIRHVAKRTNCVLIAAEWSKQLFDVDQLRSLRYPLADGAVPDEAAAAVRQVLLDKLGKVKNSVTPFYELVTNKEASGVFREQLETISSFQAEVRAARMMPSPEERKKKVASLVDRYTVASLEIPEVAFELLTLVRDNLSWETLLSFVENLPEAIQQHDFTREQTLLAKSQLGDHLAAIAGLQELIARHGETPERRGLIGGRYKRLWRSARDERKKREEPEPGLQEQGYLDDAIENYRIGTKLDLNEYYCVCNLPGLLRSRCGPGDEEEAAFLDRLTVLATQRKIDRGEDDGWARSTLLGAAFRVANVTEVARLAREVAREGPAVWQLDSTLDDINDTVDAMPESETKPKLAKSRDLLAALIK
jgi:hypothetical protein